MKKQFLGFLARCTLLAAALGSSHALAQSFNQRPTTTQQASGSIDPNAANAAAAMQDRRTMADDPRAAQVPAIGNRRNEQRTQGSPAQYEPRPRLPKLPDANVTTFEQYVQTVSGAELEVFGKSLFDDVPTTFAPFDVAQVNPDYVIGSGDELQVRGWGMVDIDITATVDRSGAIYIPHIGSVKVAGVRYADLQGYLKKAVARVYKNFELTASLSQVRTVQVYVVGHAVRPGTYTLSAMSTMLNALFTSGGPDAGGSMRNIQLKRGNTTVTSFDLYDMLVNGDKSRDATLRDGDVIHIPEVGAQVAMIGNVRRPAIFEITPKSSLADVVKWAGGFDSAAESKNVIIEKSVNNRYQTVAEVVAERDQVAARLAGVPVKPADVLRVFAPDAVAVQANIQNEYVRVSGEAKQTGVFLLRKGETLRDLMFRVGGVNPDAYVYATQLTRESLKRTQQEKLNEVADRFERDLDAAGVNRTSMTDRDAAEILAAELERQRTRVKKMREVKATGRIVLELENGEAQLKHLPDIVLQDGDSVHIPRRPGTIAVLGAVFQPSSFIYKPRRTVREYVEMAGGTTAGADKSEMYVIRADGTADSGRDSGWLSGLGGARVNDGDTVVVPDEVARNSWTQKVKEWTTILYQFGLGAAGLKVLQN